MSTLIILTVILLIVIPIYIMYHFRVMLLPKSITGVAINIAMLCLMALVCFYLFKWDSAALYYFAIIVFAVIMSAVTIRRSRLNVVRYIIPTSIGIIASSLIIGSLAMYAILGGESLLHKYVVPFNALLIINMASVTGKTLYTYCSGLRYHHQLYNFLLGNGATHNEAVDYFFRRAVARATAVATRNLSGFISLSVVVFVTMMLCGIEPFTALTKGIVILITIYSSAFLAAIIALWFTRRYSFDRYSGLKE